MTLVMVAAMVSAQLAMALATRSFSVAYNSQQ